MLYLLKSRFLFISIISAFMICGLIFCQSGSKGVSNNTVVKPDNRVFVLGLDGFTWDLALPWIEEGKLPNLKKYMETNVWGRLRSVPPYTSPPAWGSAVTGVNPGKHGVYSFFQSQQLRNDYSSKKVYMITSYDYRVPFLWDIASSYDYRVAIMNVQGTSPPRPVNGVMISGQPYVDNAPAIYPRSLADELPLFKKEEMSANCEEGHEDEWLAELYEIEKGRVDTMFRLMRTHDWDLFWSVLTSADRIQHYFWKYMDSNHPLYNAEKAKKYGNEILKIYQYMDTVLGELVDKLPDDTVLFIMSDHGFGPVYKRINVADFIFGDEYLADFITRTIKVNYNDFFSGSFYVNLRIREQFGAVETTDYEIIRDYLIKKLRELKDPDTGESAIGKIYRREEIYSGPYLFMAPDIFCEENPGYLFSGIKVKPDGNMIDLFPSFAISGSHRPVGIFLMGGKPVRESIELDEINIMDITPMALYFLGLPVPDYMDGQIRTETIQSDYLKHHPPASARMQVSTDKETLDKLKKLGYIK